MHGCRGEIGACGERCYAHEVDVAVPETGKEVWDMSGCHFGIG